ncbi:hypothetical protein ACJX0J_005348, partial [Zea mays]
SNVRICDDNKTLFSISHYRKYECAVILQLGLFPSALINILAVKIIYRFHVKLKQIMCL